MSSNTYQLVAHISCILDPKHRPAAPALLFERALVVRTNDHNNYTNRVSELNPPCLSRPSSRAGLLVDYLIPCELRFWSRTPGGTDVLRALTLYDRRSPKLGFSLHGDQIRPPSQAPSITLGDVKKVVLSDRLRDLTHL